MAVQISRTEEPKANRTILWMQGSLTREGAHWLHAKVAHLARIPTFAATSVPDGPNGPLIPEIHQYNPDAVYIPRTGQINAWDNPAWVKAIEETRRKTLLTAGTLTSVCLSFPTLSALVAGYGEYRQIFQAADDSHHEL
jgi:nicotinamidase-related amidase